MSSGLPLLISFFFTGGGISPFYIGLLSHEKENRLLWLGSFV